MFFFWPAQASVAVSIITKTIITLLAILVLDIFFLLAFVPIVLCFLDSLSTVENVVGRKIP